MWCVHVIYFISFYILVSRWICTVTRDSYHLICTSSISIQTSASCWNILLFYIYASISTFLMYASHFSRMIIVSCCCCCCFYFYFCLPIQIHLKHTYTGKKRGKKPKTSYALPYFLGNARVLLIVSCKKVGSCRCMLSFLFWMYAFSLTHTHKSNRVDTQKPMLAS